MPTGARSRFCLTVSRCRCCSDPAEFFAPSYLLQRSTRPFLLPTFRTRRLMLRSRNSFGRRSTKSAMTGGLRLVWLMPTPELDRCSLPRLAQLSLPKPRMPREPSFMSFSLTTICEQPTRFAWTRRKAIPSYPIRSLVVGSTLF